MIIPLPLLPATVINGQLFLGTCPPHRRSFPHSPLDPIPLQTFIPGARLHKIPDPSAASHKAAHTLVQSSRRFALPDSEVAVRRPTQTTQPAPTSFVVTSSLHFARSSVSSSTSTHLLLQPRQRILTSFQVHSRPRTSLRSLLPSILYSPDLIVARTSHRHPTNPHFYLTLSRNQQPWRVSRPPIPNSLESDLRRIDLDLFELLLIYLAIYRRSRSSRH